MEKLMEMDEWLSDDYDCEFETSVFNEKLQSLQDIGNIFQIRYNEHENREPALENMVKTLNSCERFINEERSTEAYVHIEDAVVSEFTTKVSETRVWLDERQQLHRTAVKTVDPPYYVTEINDKIREITLALTAIKAIPKPKPVAEEKTEETKEDEEPAENNTAEDATKPEATTEEQQAEDVEMD